MPRTGAMGPEGATDEFRVDDTVSAGRGCGFPDHEVTRMDRENTRRSADLCSPLYVCSSWYFLVMHCDLCGGKID